MLNETGWNAVKAGFKAATRLIHRGSGAPTAGNVQYKLVDGGATAGRWPTVQNSEQSEAQREADASRTLALQPETVPKKPNLREVEVTNH